MLYRTNTILLFVLMILLIMAMFNQLKADSDFQCAADNQQASVSDSVLYHRHLDNYIRYSQLDMEKALHYLDEALAVANRNNKKMEAIRIVATKAYQLSNAGRFAESLEHYQIAFELAENPNSERYYWTIRPGFTPTTERYFQLSNMHFTYGHLMVMTGNKDGRLYHYRKARDIATKNNDLRNMAYTESGLAIAYLDKEMVDSAQMLIERGLAIHEQVENKINESYLLWIQGNILMRAGEYDKAFASYAAGRRSAEETNNLNGLVINNMGLSAYFQKINEKDSSLYYANRAYEGRDMQDFQALSFDVTLAVENMYTVFEMRNEPDSMLKYLQLAKAARDSLNLRRIDNLLNFQQVLMQQQATQQEQEKQRVIQQTRNRIIAMLLLLTIVIVVAIILYRSYKHKQRANIELANTLENLKNTQSQLIHAEKMASLGELTAGIAHEIQNPLNFVNNFSEVSIEMIDEVQQGDSSVEKIHEFSLREFSLQPNVFNTLTDIRQNLDKIHHHGKRAESIVRGMLQHSRGSSSLKEPTDINALADEYLRLAYHGLRAKDKSFNATFVTDFDDTIPQIEIIPQDMGRVLLNLINNAFFAVTEKNLSGFKNLTGSSETYTPTVTVTTKNLGDRIMITVEDNGTGIPDEIKGKVFQPFFTTKPTGQGTGLGLSIAYEIVTNGHSGTMHVESEKNQFTRFVMQIPTN